MRDSEKGQVLPLALLVLAAGVLLVAPFLGHAGTTLIGSRIYGQAVTEQYSCDAGIEWALWRLKENPVLTTNTTYHTAYLAPFPSEINGSSFPVTEIRFVGGDIETITPEWQDGTGWHDYPVGLVTSGTLTVTINNITASQDVSVKLKDRPNPAQQFQGDGPYMATFDIDYHGSGTVQVHLPARTKYGPLGLGPITITITYPTGSDGTGATETIIPRWLTGTDWVSYPFRATDVGTVLVTVECGAPVVRIQLYGALGTPGSSPYTAEVEPVSPSQPDQRIQVQTRTYNAKGKEIPYYGPGTITITYPIASYDIRAQKGDRTITVRATASYLATRVIWWQVE
jgi:hypothetical protein